MLAHSDVATQLPRGESAVSHSERSEGRELGELLLGLSGWLESLDSDFECSPAGPRGVILSDAKEPRLDACSHPAS